MLKKTIKFFRNSAIILAVVSVSFSNVPFYSLTKVLDSYIAGQNIVDRAWHLSQDDNVVDKFASYRNILEKVKVYEAQAAVSFVGGNVASGTNTAYNLSLTALTGGLASSPTEGDIVVVVNNIVNTTNGNPGVGTAGYTEVYDGYISDTYDANLSTSYKIMGPTPDTVVSCNPSNLATRASDCVALVFRGVDITTPMDVTRTTALGTNSEDINCPAITPTTPGAWVLCTGAAAGASVDIATPTPPAGFVGRFIQTDPGSSGAAVASYMSWTGGAVDPAPYVMDLGTASQNSWVAATLALRPRNYPPELIVSQPDGTGDTVMAGDLYDITYDLNDIEEPVTVAMYYDTDAVGLNGTAITGACATANEGTGVTCSWDTTGVTPGTYYVYGLTSDGYNPQVSDYSPGMITIVPPPTITDYSNTTEPALDYSPACTTCGARIGGGAGYQHEVTLTGVTFGTDPGVGNRSTATNNVTVGGHRIADANITSWSDTSISFKTDSSEPGDTDGEWGTEFGGAGALAVTAGGITSAALNFYVFPQIISITPPVGLLTDQAREYDAGDTDGIITLIGTRLGTAQGSGGTAAGLSGGYYCGTNFDTYSSTYQDTTVNFNPADTPLGDRACGPDTFSVRWSGYVRADFSETFTFYTTSDDGVRLWVDGNQIINNWTDHGPVEDSGTVAMIAGAWVPIVLEFYEAGGGAVITLSYSSASEGKKIIPSTNLQTIVVGGAGSVTIVGQDATINSWGNEEIIARVPTTIDNTVNTGSVVVAQGTGGFGALTHTYANTLRILPRITGFNPTSGNEGAAVTVQGNHFCQTGVCPGAFDANDYVTYTNEKVVTGATTWTHTSITTTVPVNSVSGDVIVTSNNLTSNPSFFTVISLRPNAPTLMNQWRNVGLDDSIPAQGAASSTPIYLTMEVENTGIMSGTLYPEIEYKPVGTAFTCVTPNVSCVDAQDSSTGVAAPGPHDCANPANNCAIPISPTDDVYHWQGRVHYVTTGNAHYYGPWVSFDDVNPESATDFQIDGTPPVTTFPGANTCASAISNLGTNSVQIDWSLNESSTGQVEYSTDSNLSGSTLFPVVAQPSGFPHTVTLSNLNSGTTYYFRTKSQDNAGNIGYRPTANPYCSFTTLSNLSPAKTITTYIDGAIGMISSVVQYYFTANVPETEASMQNAYIEVFGVVTGGTGTVSIQANGVASRAYDVTAASPTLYRLLYQITSPGTEANLNLNDIAPCTNGELTGLPPEVTPPCNALTVTPSGVSMYVLSTKLITTYTYTP